MSEKCKWTDANVDVHIWCFVCCSTLHLSLNHEVSSVLQKILNSLITLGMFVLLVRIVEGYQIN